MRCSSPARSPQSGRPLVWRSAVLYLGGLRWWPGAVIGDLLSNTWTAPLGTTIAVTAANLAEIVVATLLLWRLIGRRAQLDRLDQVGGMLVAIAPAVAITATVGSLSLLADGVIHSARARQRVAHALARGRLGRAGRASSDPGLGAPSRRGAARRALEAAAMIAAVVGLSELELSSSRATRFPGVPGADLGRRTVRPAGRDTRRGLRGRHGRVAHRPPRRARSCSTRSRRSALSTQLYIAVAALTTLCLGAVVSEHQRSAADLVESPSAARSSARRRSASGSRATCTTRSPSRCSR